MHCHLAEYRKQGQRKAGQSSTMDLCKPNVRSVLQSCWSAATYLKAFLIKLHRVLTLEVFHKHRKMMYVKHAQMYTINPLRCSKGKGKFRYQLTFPVVSMLFLPPREEGKERCGKLKNIFFNQWETRMWLSSSKVRCFSQRMQSFCIS